MGYSIDLREKVVSYVRKGHSKEESAKVFGINVRTVFRWLRKTKQGSLADKKPSRPWRKIDSKKLIEAVSKNGDWLLSDFAKLFNVTTPAISWAFRTLKITRKKRVHSTAKEMSPRGRYFWSISENIKQKNLSM